IAQVNVTGDGSSVFLVRAKGVGFATMTITPTNLATGNNGSHGIVYDAPLSTAEASVANVTIPGVLANDTTAGTGSGIMFTATSSASPTIGPVTISGGYHGIFVQGTAAPSLTGTST